MIQILGQRLPDTLGGVTGHDAHDAFGKFPLSVGQADALKTCHDFGCHFGTGFRRRVRQQPFDIPLGQVFGHVSSRIPALRAV